MKPPPLAYRFDTVQTAPPGSGDVRVDAAYPYLAVSTLWASATSNDGLEALATWLALPVGTTLVLQDTVDREQVLVLETTGAPVDHTTYAAVPVTCVAQGGAALGKNQQILIDGTTRQLLAPLATLQEAKDHLRITTPEGDPGDRDLLLKLAAAHDAVRSYCGSTAYWRGTVAAWTRSTVPLAVHAAILYQLGELYMFRGDDTHREDPDRSSGQDLSPKVRDLLRPWRDPVVA